MLVASSWLVALVSLQSSSGSRAAGVLPCLEPLFDDRWSVELMLAGSAEQAIGVSYNLCFVLLNCVET